MVRFKITFWTALLALETPFFTHEGLLKKDLIDLLGIFETASKKNIDKAKVILFHVKNPYIILIFILRTK